MATIDSLSDEVLTMIIGLSIQSRHRHTGNPSVYALVCRRWQRLADRHTLRVVRLRPGHDHVDITMFKRIFSRGVYRRQYLAHIDIDFDLRSTPLDLPARFHGSEEQRAMMTMTGIDPTDPPRISYHQFEAQLQQDNIRMTTFLFQLFRHLKEWKTSDVKNGITLRFIAERPTY